MVIETFRFEDENAFKYEIWFKLFPNVLSKKWRTGKLNCTFFPRKVSIVIFLDEVKASPGCKMIKLPIYNFFLPLRPSF